MCKRDGITSNGKDGKTTDGQTNNIYKFLEASGHYYISLLSQGPVETLSTSIYPSSKDTGSQSILFNESRLGNVTGQEDVIVATSEDQDMIKIVTDHRRELKVGDSKEMMVGIAYAMPFELDQFALFHVSLHIDATSDNNKEGWPCHSHV